jgi:hypothetical protein
MYAPLDALDPTRVNVSDTKHSSQVRTARRRKHLLCLFGASLVVALAVNTSSAAAGNWSPAGDEVVVDSTNVAIELGGKKITCEATVGEGKLASPASSTWTFTPEFSQCSNAISVEGSWTAKDVNGEEATLEIPTKAKAVVMEVSSGCDVDVENGGTVGSSKDYVNGTNGLEKPSELTLTAQAVTIKDSPKKCVAPCSTETTSADISGQMLFFNFTSMAEAIKVS